MRNGEPVGVSVGSFASVSLKPPLVGFFIARTSTTWPHLAAAGGFCASILAADQEDLCRTFARPGADRFGSCGWEPGPSMNPIISGAAAWVDCDLHQVVDAGDHQLVLGAVTSMSMTEGVEPLVFLGGRYGAVRLAAEPATGWA
jgi:3-hydroxy-9,10-secoandrosta-1,3,5(10)-triene-9,17-dione monooxygenase reductase component